MGSLDPCQTAHPPSLVGVSFLVPKKNRRPPPDTLWSLRSESQGTPRALRRVTAPFGQGLIVRLIRRLTTAERRGTSSVKFPHHFLQATPPCTRSVLCGYSSTPQREVGLPTPALQTRWDLDAQTRPQREASRSLTAWPRHRRPCGTPLAAYPSRRRVRAVTAVRGRTRTGRI